MLVIYVSDSLITVVYLNSKFINSSYSLNQRNIPIINQKKIFIINQQKDPSIQETNKKYQQLFLMNLSTAHHQYNDSMLLKYNASVYYQYSLALIRKIKHQIYDLLHLTVSQSKTFIPQYHQNSHTGQEQNTNPQLLEFQFKPISLIDLVEFLQNLPFKKYQEQLIQIINLCQSSITQTYKENQGLDRSIQVQQIQFQYEDKSIQASSNEILQCLSLKSPKAVGQSQDDSEQFFSPCKKSECSNENELLSKENHFLSGQRQLELLIKEKQNNKKILELTSQITQLTQELQQIKAGLQTKQSQIHYLKKQLHLKDKSNHQITREVKTLKSIMEEQFLINERGDKVNSLKGKIKLESMRREISLQRQRDNMQLMIQKENIHSNHQLSHFQTLQKPIDSTNKRLINTLKSTNPVQRTQLYPIRHSYYGHQHNYETHNFIDTVDESF